MSEAFDADQEAATSEKLQRLDIAIAGLPAIYKEPLLLTSMTGLSRKDAATILRISTKALEMRLYRARQRLAAAMDRDPEG